MEKVTPSENDQKADERRIHREIEKWCRTSDELEQMEANDKARIEEQERWGQEDEEKSCEESEIVAKEQRKIKDGLAMGNTLGRNGEYEEEPTVHTSDPEYWETCMACDYGEFCQYYVAAPKVCQRFELKMLMNPTCKVTRTEIHAENFGKAKSILDAASKEGPEWCRGRCCAILKDMHRVLSVRPAGFDALPRNARDVSFEIELCTIMELTQWHDGEPVEYVRHRVVQLMSKVDLFAWLLGDAVIAQTLASSSTVT